MRGRNILFAVAVLAVVAVLVWRPWRDEPAPAEDVAATAPEAPAVAPPPSSPPPPSRPTEAVDATAVPLPPIVRAPPARSRDVVLARLPDAGVVPVVPTSENRGHLQALHKAMVGAVPAAARLHAEFARAGRPVPPAARRLLEMKRGGASHDEMAGYVRSAFTEPDLSIAMRWLDAPVGAAGTPARGDGG